MKKVPPYKKVSITIEKNHELFKHKRWAQQLTELINQHHIDAEFQVKNSQQEEYFATAGLHYTTEWNKGIRWYFEKAKKRLFSTKSIHKQLLAKKNAPSYLIVWAEVAVLIVVGSFFRWLVSPKAEITIVPSHEIVPIVYQYWFHLAWSGASTNSELHDQITIPYSIGNIEYNQEMTIDVQDITYSYSPANGQVEFINTLQDPVSLVWGTQLTTTWWALFTLDRRINIPAWTENRPWKVRVNVTARDYTDEWVAIWALWNIDHWTELYIKNLEESLEDKKVIAVARRWFDNWETIGKWTVIQEDIEDIEQTILVSMEKNKRSHLQEQFNDHDTVIILPFDELITFSVNEFISTATVWDNATFVDWIVKSDLQYAYITVEDFFDSVEQYIKERPIQWKFLIDYDPHSIAFYTLNREQENPSHFTIPIKVNTIRWYNFFDDDYDLWKEMINTVKQLSRKEAKEKLLEYEEVRDVTIKLSPPRYDTLPQENQRINIKHTLSNW